ncbi:hypothetical protein BB558_002104 [Smittium angustum]|uniref:Peptidase A1 domain-containing protein n=1 Tax=Smittium angustum TaxID=133377 RepID=A0A2U1J9X0_SMIAN|nr:hypothetical protein BB558_002104 [Smittium angustum]
MNLGIAVSNQIVSIPVKNPNKKNEIFKRTDNGDEGNGRIDVNMIRGDNGYYVELEVGNPQQNLRFQIDTESYIQLIVSDKCDSCFINPENRKKFNGIDTKSFLLDKQANFVKFGISFGGYLPTEPLYLRKDISENVEFMALSITSEDIESFIGYDGVIGIGYPKTDTFHQNLGYGNSFIDNCLRRDKIISINLKPGVEKISFGYQNKERTTLDTVWVNQIERNSFKFSTQKVKIGLTEFQNIKKAIVNPIYQKTYLQRDQISIINSFIANSRNCMNINALPAITFTIGDGMLTLEPKDYITFNNGVCESNIEEIDSDKFDSDIYILGQNFFQKYVVTFDYGNSKIGFTN